MHIRGVQARGRSMVTVPSTSITVHVTASRSFVAYSQVEEELTLATMHAKLMLEVVEERRKRNR